MKQRFPILANCVRLSLEKIPKVIVSCAVLHNISKHVNDDFDFDAGLNVNFQDGEEMVMDIPHVEDRETRMRGEEKRMLLLDFLNE